VVRRHVERLADREQAHRQDHDVDAVEQLGHAERKARLAGLAVDADQAEEQANEQAGQPAHRRIAEHRRHGDESEHHQREVVRRAEFEREVDHQRRQQREQKGGDRAGDERADRAGRQRRAGAPRLRHAIAFERGGDRSRLPRRVQQDRGGGAAEHRAVVDAGEHDERAGGIKLDRERQQHRHGERRPDAGQHADERAKRDADQPPHQVHRLQGYAEAGDQGMECFHVRFPRRRAAAQASPPADSR
jgi:hypothetical protein